MRTKRTNDWLQRFGLQLPARATNLGSIGSVSYVDGEVNTESIPAKQYIQKRRRKALCSASPFFMLFLLSRNTKPDQQKHANQEKQDSSHICQKGSASILDALPFDSSGFLFSFLTHGSCIALRCPKLRDDIPCHRLHEMLPVPQRCAAALEPGLRLRPTLEKDFRVICPKALAKMWFHCSQPLHIHAHRNVGHGTKHHISAVAEAEMSPRHQWFSIFAIRKRHLLRRQPQLFCQHFPCKATSTEVWLRRTVSRHTLPFLRRKPLRPPLHLALLHLP